MTDVRPGLNPRRLVRLMAEAVGRCELNLSGKVVLTEAATGAYVTTPILAALAGAEQVYGLTRTTPYGTVEEVTAATLALARLAGVDGRVRVITDKDPDVIARADVVTNSGHLRPIDADTVNRMKPTAVVPLMYEAWEFRAGDVDLDACRRRGIRFAGTNERHPAVDVFSYLGVMAVKQLLDAGVAVYGSKVVLWCDNPFAPHIRAGLVNGGAEVELVQDLAAASGSGGVDAVVVAVTPGEGVAVGAAEAAAIAGRWPGAVVAQYWGDTDRAALERAGVPVWPPAAPRRGHMGVLPSAVGPEPIVRLQSGSLKVAEVLLRGGPGQPGWEYVDALE